MSHLQGRKDLQTTTKSVRKPEKKPCHFCGQIKNFNTSCVFLRPRALGGGDRVKAIRLSIRLLFERGVEILFRDIFWPFTPWIRKFVNGKHAIVALLTIFLCGLPAIRNVKYYFCMDMYSLYWVVMESELQARDRIGVQDFVLLEDYKSEDAFLENLRKRYNSGLIYVSIEIAWNLAQYLRNIRCGFALSIQSCLITFNQLWQS